MSDSADCDCTHEGNRQIIGPRCQQAIDDAWAETVHLDARRIYGFDLSDEDRAAMVRARHKRP